MRSFIARFKGGVAEENWGVCRTCTPLIWPQMASWWASTLVLRVIKLRPSLWSEECSIKQLTSSSCWGFHSAAQRHCHLCLLAEPGPCSRAALLLSEYPPPCLHTRPLPSSATVPACLWNERGVESGGLTCFTWPRDPGGPARFSVIMLLHICTVFRKGVKQNSENTTSGAHVRGEWAEKHKSRLSQGQ